MKINPKYETSKWRKFERWVDGDSIPTEAEIEEKLENTTNLKNGSKKGNNKKKEDLQEVEETDLEDVLAAYRQQEMNHFYTQYKNWPKTKGLRLFKRVYNLIAIIVCVSMILVLLTVVSYLPKFGDVANPANNEVTKRYIENGLEETGAVNIVAGMILDYRAFDTLGESHVLFIAACCVLILLRIDYGKDGKPTSEKIAEEENDRNYEPKNDKILQKTAFVLVPPIILFGIYIILNGHLSPGGGFSGGAIIGAGLILYLNAFGFKKTQRFLSYRLFQKVTLVALLFYSAAKTYSFYTGANHLKNMIPKGTAGNILSSGLILPLNICVGMVVACTLYSFYCMFRKGGM